MNIRVQEDHRKEFKNILQDLASSDSYLSESSTRSSIYKRLEDLYYKGGFRHFYSDIFDVVSQLHNKNIRGSNEFLAQNISTIRGGYNPQNLDEKGNLIDIGKSIDKLYDHLNLEIGRLNCFSTSKETAERLSSVDTKIIELNKEVGESSKSLKRQQAEYISILGIFASIVLAFTGGMAFSTSVLDNINTVDAYRIIIVALIIGLVLCNVVFGLFHFLGHMIKGKASIMPFLVSNIIIVTMLIVSVAAWDNGWIEKRDAKIAMMAQQADGSQINAEDLQIQGGTPTSSDGKTN